MSGLDVRTLSVRDDLSDIVHKFQKATICLPFGSYELIRHFTYDLNFSFEFLYVFLMIGEFRILWFERYVSVCNCLNIKKIRTSYSVPLAATTRLRFILLNHDVAIVPFSKSLYCVRLCVKISNLLRKTVKSKIHGL